MALIGMAIYSTEENKKDECLEKTLDSLSHTVDFYDHALGVSINAATPFTEFLLDRYKGFISIVVRNEENIGTAEAINKIWKHRKAGQHAIKMDDDIVINQPGWVDILEEAISRDPENMGIIGLKRKDLIQTTWHPDPHYRSELVMLPHEPGHRWLTIEKTDDVIGSCTMFNSKLLDQIGYLKQIKKYGYDDNLACHRAHLAGFYNCFYSHIDINHVDQGATPYQQWKHDHSSECTTAFIQLVKDFISGKEPIYYNPFI